LPAAHGGVTIGSDLDRAFEATRPLEWLREVYVRAKAAGEPRVLTDEELTATGERAFAPHAFPRRALS